MWWVGIYSMVLYQTITMPKHTITITEATNQKFKVYKAFYGLDGISEVVEKLAEQIEMPNKI